MKKVVWITGASSGIGEALAKEYNRLGYAVVLSARRQEELERVQGELTDPAASLVLPMDMLQTESFAGALETLLAHMQRLDILILNAGATTSATALDMPLALQRSVMELNHFSNIALTQAVLPTFLQQGSGQFIPVSSVLGVIGVPLRSAYASSKHALIGYFDCLRIELPPSIAVSILLPGYVKTNITQNALTASGEKLGRSTKANSEGMEPDVFARKAVARLNRQPPRVYIGGFLERLSMHLYYWAPNVLFKMLRKRKIDD